MIGQIEGREYHPTTEVVRKNKLGEPSCDSISPMNEYGDDWICERQAGHQGKHIAWQCTQSGLIYPGGMWE